MEIDEEKVKDCAHQLSVVTEGLMRPPSLPEELLAVNIC